MFQVNGHVSLCLIVVVVTLPILCGGCGSGGSNNGMSQAQAQAVTEQVSEAVAQALENAFSPGEGAVRRARPSLSTVVRSIRPDQSSGCTPSGSGKTAIGRSLSMGRAPKGDNSRRG
jgi:hypothetical protein